MMTTTTMRVRVLFFAQYREVAGTETLELELPAGADAASLVAAVRARGGGFEQLPAQPVVAVNRSYTSLERSLANGDEIAFLPPVAGG